ncbi:MAG: threonine synthase [Clostridia bacterium]|nr:threonine synthase [Clostridia bacterium]
MKFVSTRGVSVAQSAAHAIVKGLADDGGLFVPERFPSLKESLNDMLNMPYPKIASLVIHSFLEEYDYDEMLNECEKAYSLFDDGEPAPVVKLDDGLFVTELFHGPTLAFKDVALTFLSYLLRRGSDITGMKDKIMILVATSGDTGKAALEGFKDKEGISIMVFYPSEGVSDMQKLQMQTQEGKNVKVYGVKGNFDDCQNTVKEIFNSKSVCQSLKECNTVLSSANSMSFGRLVPQISYYFSSYCDLVNSGDIKMGDLVDFVVPTGNFGDILAGYYAKQMGLPVGRLVCASNCNNVLTEFFQSGTYDKNREFFKTNSPSMDILISSNLERLLFELSNRDAKLTAERMASLKATGKYSLTDLELKQAEKDFFGGYADEEECLETITNVFDDFGYVSDPHTAVALKVCFDYKEFSKTSNPTVVLSTASPYKFTQSVLKAVSGKTVKDPFVCAQKLLEETALPIPNQILSLKEKERRFTETISKEQAVDVVLQFAKEN